MKTFRDFVNEDKDSDYDAFFKKALKKYGVDSPADLSDEKKKEFFDYVDKNWKSDGEVNEMKIDYNMFPTYEEAYQEIEKKFGWPATSHVLDMIQDMDKGMGDAQAWKKYSRRFPDIKDGVQKIMRKHKIEV